MQSALDGFHYKTPLHFISKSWLGGFLSGLLEILLIVVQLNGAENLGRRDTLIAERLRWTLAESELFGHAAL